MSISILDTSKWDGNGPDTFHAINWQLAKAKWAGAIVKASQGPYADPLYGMQISAMLAAGVPWGSYHFFDASGDVLTAAGLFCSFVEKNGGYGRLGVWLDCESNLGNLPGAKFILLMGSWLDAVAKRMVAAGCSYPLGIYSRASFLDPLWIAAGSPNWLQRYPGWLAGYRYDAAPDFEIYYAQVMSGQLIPPLPSCRALPNLYCHQWTARGHPADVPGYPPYKKAVDFNFWLKGISDVPQPPADPIEARFKALEGRLTALEDKVFG